MLGRIGGDEFVAVLRDVTDEQTVRSCAEHLMAVMRQPFHLPAGTVRIGASIGTATTDDPAMDTAGLIDRADCQMYVVKRGREAVVTAAAQPAPEPGVPHRSVWTVASP